jgi:hypothetical protein
MGGDFDEIAHPRAADGKFGAGGGRAAAILSKAKEGKLVKPRAPEVKPPTLDEHHERRISEAREYAALQAKSKVLADHGVNAFEHGMDQQWRARGQERPGGQRIPAETHAKVQPLIDEAAGHAAKHAEATVRDEIANEQRALAAGHITAPPDVKLKAFHEAAERSATKLDGVHEALDSSARKASDELAKLSAMHDVLAGAGVDDHQGAVDHLSGIDAGHAAADAVAGVAHEMRTPHADRPPRAEHEPPEHKIPEISGEHEFSYHERPERDPEDSEGEHAEHIADYEKFRADVDAHHEAFKRQAEIAHDALEDLHASQTAAIRSVGGEVKAFGKAHEAAVREIERIDPDDGGLVNDKAFAHHERGEDDEISDRSARAEHDAAVEASRSLLGSEHDRRDRMNPIDHDEVLSTLRDGLAETSSNLKAISKITGRSPRARRAAAD